jgi:DNA-binding transcriptional regulator LsrR (DeoR family)
MLGFSRPKVARLLQKAKEQGIVEIRIRTPPDLDMGLELKFAERFGLAQVVLFPDQVSEEARRTQAALAAAELLTRSIQDDSVVAVGMGRNASGVADELANPPHRACTFVSAIGGSPQVGTGNNPNDICRRLAERFGGRTRSLYAPAYAETTAARKTLLEHADARDSLACARQADIALVGIGDARDKSAVVQMGCFSPREMTAMRKAGAVGDILGFFFDIDGKPITVGAGSRVVGIGASDLRAIPRVIAVTSEEGKELAILGALRTEIINVLVTSVGTARKVLDHADTETRKPARNRTARKK